MRVRLSALGTVSAPASELALEQSGSLATETKPTNSGTGGASPKAAGAGSGHHNPKPPPPAVPALPTLPSPTGSPPLDPDEHAATSGASIARVRVLSIKGNHSRHLSVLLLRAKKHSRLFNSSRISIRSPFLV